VFVGVLELITPEQDELRILADARGREIGRIDPLHVADITEGLADFVRPFEVDPRDLDQGFDLWLLRVWHTLRDETSHLKYSSRLLFHLFSHAIGGRREDSCCW